MTTIVTRLYPDKDTAETAVTALKLQNHPEGNIDIVTAGKGAEDALRDAQVPEDSAAAYASAMKRGQAVVVVRAPVTPFGAARNAIDTLDEFESVDAGVENENYYVTTEPDQELILDSKVDRSHRHWATWGNERRRGRISDAFGLPMVYSGTRFFGSYLAPPLTSRKHWGSFILPPISHREPGRETVYSGKKLFGSFLMDPISRAGPVSNAGSDGGHANVS